MIIDNLQAELSLVLTTMLRHHCQGLFKLVSVIEDFLCSLSEGHHLLRNFDLRVV